MGTGANATAIAYMELRLPDGSTAFGAGIDKNIVVVSLKAVLSGVNRVGKRRVTPTSSPASGRGQPIAEAMGR